MNKSNLTKGVRHRELLAACLKSWRHKDSRSRVPGMAWGMGVHGGVHGAGSGHGALPLGIFVDTIARANHPLLGAELIEFS